MIEKESAVLFGPSKIRIKHTGGGIDTSISNDGKRLVDGNASIIRVDDHTALVTLNREEQSPEMIEIDFSHDGGTVKAGTKNEPVLDPFVVKTEESPGGRHIT